MADSAHQATGSSSLDLPPPIIPCIESSFLAKAASIEQYTRFKPQPKVGGKRTSFSFKIYYREGDPPPNLGHPSDVYLDTTKGRERILAKVTETTWVEWLFFELAPWKLDRINNPLIPEALLWARLDGITWATKTIMDGDRTPGRRNVSGSVADAVRRTMERIPGFTKRKREEEGEGSGTNAQKTQKVQSGNSPTHDPHAPPNDALLMPPADPDDVEMSDDPSNAPAPPVAEDIAMSDDPPNALAPSVAADTADPPNTPAPPVAEGVTMPDNPPNTLAPNGQTHTEDEDAAQQDWWRSLSPLTEYGSDQEKASPDAPSKKPFLKRLVDTLRSNSSIWLKRCGIEFPKNATIIDWVSGIKTVLPWVGGAVSHTHSLALSYSLLSSFRTSMLSNTCLKVRTPRTPNASCNPKMSSLSLSTTLS